MFTDDGNLHFINVANGKIMETQKVVGDYQYNVGAFQKDEINKLLVVGENNKKISVVDFEKSEIFENLFKY